jgi:hypothetical protein
MCLPKRDIIAMPSKGIHLETVDVVASTVPNV